MRRFAPIFLFIVLLGAFIRPTQAEAPLPGDFMGMVIRDPHYEWNTNPSYPNTVNKDFYDQMASNLVTLGVKYVRIEMRAEDGIPYDAANPANGLRFSNYDYFINVVAPAHDLKVIVLLATNLVRNPGYIDPNEIERSDQEIGTCWTYKYGCGTNSYMRIWLDRAFAIAARYQDRVAAYEVMNEENRYLNGGGKGISPLKMSTLLTKFYRVFKDNHGPDGSFGTWVGGVKILLGGLHPDRCDDCGTGGMNDRQYLDALYTGGPFQDYYWAHSQRYPLDGVGYHPYPMEMRSGLVPEPTGYDDLFRVPARMQAIRQVMLDNRDAANKIWVTEVGDRGAPSTVDPGGDNEARQAAFMHTVYWMLWQDRDFVETVLWFKYEDFAVPTNSPPAIGPENWGVVRLAPRPSSQPACGSCEYDMYGAVQWYKQAFATFANMSNSGTGLETYHVFLPQIVRATP